MSKSPIVQRSMAGIIAKTLKAISDREHYGTTAKRKNHPGASGYQADIHILTWRLKSISILQKKTPTVF